jgi:hypothetical protein
MMSGSHRKKSQRRPVSPSRTTAEGTSDSDTDRTDQSSSETDEVDLDDLDRAIASLAEVSANLDDLLAGPDTTKQTSTGEQLVSEEGPDTFATNKRAVSLTFDAGPGFEFEETLPEKAVKPSLEVHPLITDGTVEAPLFKEGIGGGVGLSAGRVIDQNTLAFYRFPDPKWYRNRSGIPMIKCHDFIEDRSYFVPRSELVESTYAMTVEAIDDRKTWLDKQEGVQNVFLVKQQELSETGTITLPHAVTGYLEESLDGDDPEKGSVTVPPGEHAITGFVTRKITTKQRSPFSVVVSVEGLEVVISSDLAWGVDKSHNEQAEQLNVVESVNSSRIMAVFAENDWIKPYLPPGGWLRDDQIHYVTPDEMGAVFVLREMPAPGEAPAARQQNEAKYIEGQSTPGVRFGEHIHIQNSERGTGTEYHEAIHKLSHQATNLVLGNSFNEGVTEYLTRRLTEGLVQSGEIVRNDQQYAPQYHAIEAMMRQTGITDDELNEAYFRGILEPLYEKVTNAGVHAPFTTLAPFSLDGFASRLGSGTATAAQQMLTFACGTVTETATDDVVTTTTTTTHEAVSDTTLPDDTGGSGSDIS